MPSKHRLRTLATLLVCLCACSQEPVDGYIAVKIDREHSPAFNRFMASQDRPFSIDGEAYSVGYYGDVNREGGKLVGDFMVYASLPTEGTSWYFKQDRLICCNTASSRVAYLEALYGDTIVSDIRMALSELLTSHVFYSKFIDYLVTVEQKGENLYLVYSAEMSATDQNELRIIVENAPGSLPKLSDFLRQALSEEYGSLYAINDYLVEKVALRFQ